MVKLLDLFRWFDVRVNGLLLYIGCINVSKAWHSNECYSCAL